MASAKDTVIIIDMEDDEEEDKNVKIEMEADAADGQGDTDTVIDFLDQKVAETVIDIEDEDAMDAGQHTDAEDRTGIGTDDDGEGDATQDAEGEDRTGIGTDADQEGDAEVRAEEEGQEEREVGFARQVAVELWEHMRDLLEDFTAHGFNHLFQRERDGRYNKRKIIMWALAIFVAYFASTYYTIASVQEAERTPIATAVGYFPVDEVRHNLNNL